MDKFIRSEIEESQRVLAYLCGEDISASPLWHAPGVPTFYGALELAKMFDIQTVETRVDSYVSRGQRIHLGIVRCKHGNCSRFGAGVSGINADVAKCFAFRNAVRHCKTFT